MITVILSVATTLVYVAGWKFFMSGGLSVGSFIAWLFSPITVPVGLVILAVVYRH